jgi:hypothetical protein
MLFDTSWNELSSGSLYSLTVISFSASTGSSFLVTSSSFKEGGHDCKHTDEKSVMMTRDLITDQSIENQIPHRCTEIEVIHGSKVSLNQKIKIN